MERETRRLFSDVLTAFNQACDDWDPEVAHSLLVLLETLVEQSHDQTINDIDQQRLGKARLRCARLQSFPSGNS